MNVVYVITKYDGEVYGAYSDKETAVYAYEYAPGSCSPPQEVEVLKA